MKNNNLNIEKCEGKGSLQIPFCDRTKSWDPNIQDHEQRSPGLSSFNKLMFAQGSIKILTYNYFWKFILFEHQGLHQYFCTLIWLIYAMCVYTYQDNSCAKFGSSHHSPVPQYGYYIKFWGSILFLKTLHFHVWTHIH